MTQSPADVRTTLEPSDPCSSLPCTRTTMIPARRHSLSSAEPPPPLDARTLNADELERRQFYNTYNAWTGINIAASLGGFFLLLILLLLYKSKCKRRSKYPPCPSVEDGEVSLLEPWEAAFLGSSVADGLSLGSARHLSLESTPAGTAVGSRHSLAAGRGSRHSLAGKCACSAPGSVQRLSRRPRLSSGGSSTDAGHQLELRVHHPPRRGPPRYAYSFDEKASVPEGWWQRVDINVIQPTPSVTPSPSLRCLAADGEPAAAAVAVPRLELPRPRRGSVVSSSDLTDCDSHSIGSDSVFLADDDWSSCSEAAGTPRGRRRSPLSRQASVCLDDEPAPDASPEAAARTELLFAPGLEAGSLRAPRPDGGGAPRSASPQFLTVPTAHGAPRSPPARRSPHFLSPPPPTYGPVRSMSPPPPPVSPGAAGRRLAALGRQTSVCCGGGSSSSSSSTTSLPAEPAAPAGAERCLQSAADDDAASSDVSTNAGTLTASEERPASSATISRDDSLSRDVSSPTATADDSAGPPGAAETETALKLNGEEAVIGSGPRFEMTLSCPEQEGSSPVAAEPTPSARIENERLHSSPTECRVLLTLPLRGSSVESSGAESADTPL